ncbi:MAG: hypothetical protein MZV63_24780 [Marinilabiliales bacterium]|nr:hypothetical protein [Marinilabiliales bacterium]
MTAEGAVMVCTARADKPCRVLPHSPHGLQPAAGPGGPAAEHDLANHHWCFCPSPSGQQHIPARSFAALFMSLAGVYIISSQGCPFHPGRSDALGVIAGTLSAECCGHSISF